MIKPHVISPKIDGGAGEIEKEDLPSAVNKQLQNLATFQNPDFYKTQAISQASKE